jgi:predicted transglutaminase-like cysteine proteinase
MAMLPSRNGSAATETIAYGMDMLRLAPRIPAIRRPGLRAGLAALFLLAATGADAAPKPVTAHLVAMRGVAAPSAARDLCGRYPWACARGASRPRGPGDALALARTINRAVNSEVRQVTDRSQYGREDIWGLPTARGGDCEDFVLEKKRRLIEAGLPGSALLIATVLDRRRQGHAVLVLRTRSGDYVLDNLGNQVVPWHRTGYSFLRMQNPAAPQKWDAIAAGGIFSVTASIGN